MATNALLERKGHKHALLITKGFKDLLLIGNQSRPKIFDLNIRRPPPLYSTVLEVDERVTLVGYTSDPQAEENAVQFDEHGNLIRGYRGAGWDGQGDAEGPGKIVQGISGEAVRIMKTPGKHLPFKNYGDILTNKICRSGPSKARPANTLSRGLPFARDRLCPFIHLP